MLFFSFSLFFPNRTSLWLGHFGLASCSLWPVHTAWIRADLSNYGVCTFTHHLSLWLVHIVFCFGFRAWPIHCQHQCKGTDFSHYGLTPSRTIYHCGWTIPFLASCFVRGQCISRISARVGTDLNNYGVFNFTHHLSQWLDHRFLLRVSCLANTLPASVQGYSTRPGRHFLRLSRLYLFYTLQETRWFATSVIWLLSLAPETFRHCGKVCVPR